MNANELVQNLIKCTIQRAIQESVACVIVMIAFTLILQHSVVGTARYYGCLLILISTGFIAGVVWSFALSYKMLRTHPATDTGFWREAFHSQARLLKLVPLWYLGPLMPGIVLICAPTRPGDLPAFLILAAIIGAVFAALIWVNRRAAAQIEAQAAQLES